MGPPRAETTFVVNRVISTVRSDSGMAREKTGQQKERKLWKSYR
jgi:hypothetical protein